jgi:hypothetical protein
MNTIIQKKKNTRLCFFFFFGPSILWGFSSGDYLYVHLAKFEDVQNLKVGKKKKKKTYATFHIVGNCGEILGGLIIFKKIIFGKFSFKKKKRKLSQNKIK